MSNTIAPTVSDVELGEKDVLAPKPFCCGKLNKKPFIAMICGIVTLLVITALLIGVFVGGPAIAQSAVNDSVITFESMSIVDENFDDCPKEAVFCLNTDMVFNVENGAMSTTMETFEGTLTHNGNVFGTTQMPELALEGSATTKFTKTIVMVISSKDNFDVFAAALLVEETVNLGMSGDVSVKSFGMTFSGLTMEKLIPILGFASFVNPMPFVTKFGITLPNKEQKALYQDVPGVMAAVFANVLISLPNPSIVAIGDAGLMEGDLFYNDVKIGVAIAQENVAIQLGNDTVMKALCVMQTTIKNAGVMPGLMMKMLGGKELVLQMKGTYTTNHVWEVPMMSMVASVLMPEGIISA